MFGGTNKHITFQSPNSFCRIQTCIRPSLEAWTGKSFGMRPTPNATADDLHGLWIMFADSPFVVPTDLGSAGDPALWNFRASSYAKDRAEGALRRLSRDHYGLRATVSLRAELLDHHTITRWQRDEPFCRRQVNSAASGRVPRLAKFTLDALARSFQVREDGIEFGDHRVGGFALGIVSLVRGDDCVQRGI